MYSFNSRVRYSETDSEGKLSLESLLDYFQDCSTFHSEDIGVGIEYVSRHHLVWVLSAWQIVVERYPILCENIKISTAPYEFKGFMGFRNFLMETEEGERLAYANSVWTLMDMENMRPARVTEEMKTAYVLEEPLAMNYASRKIELPECSCIMPEAIQMKQHHLDTNHHVNNGQYVRIAAEYLPAGIRIKQMRAEYKKQAVLGDRVYPAIYMTEKNKCTVMLNNEEKQPFCIVEFVII